MSSESPKILSFIKSLKNNEVMYLPRLQAILLDDWKSLSKDAQNYLLIPNILIGVRDIRDRFGSFKDPWNSTCPSAWRPPQLTFISDSLSDIADERAVEIVKQAKQTQRKIMIMWSGGIDSTFALTAFLKNMDQADYELLTVCLTTHSIIDNSNFYFKHLSPNKRIKLISGSDLHFITNEFLTSNILIHGDPGDGIFGPSSSMYQFFSNEGTHLEPWKKHLNKIVESLEPTQDKDMLVQPGLGKWLSDIISKSIEESGHADHISTIADFWWWSYFNFKYAGVCTYPLHNGITKTNHPGITGQNYQFYADTVFYHTDKFQNWSYSNLKTLIGKDVFKTHKLKAREYIYEFDKNFQYFSRKRKTSTPPPNQKNQISSVIGHDANFKPIVLDYSKTRDIVLTLCRDYNSNV